MSRAQWDAFLEELLKDKGPGEQLERLLRVHDLQAGLFRGRLLTELSFCVRAGRQRMCLLSFWLARTKQRDMAAKKKSALLGESRSKPDGKGADPPKQVALHELRLRRHE